MPSPAARWRISPARCGSTASPATYWGAWWKRPPGSGSSEFLSDRLFKPLAMNDTAFWVPKDKLQRLAEPLPVDRPSGKPNKLIDVSAAPKNDSGGAGGVSTAADYLRFSQMLLNGGTARRRAHRQPPRRWR